MFFAVRSILYHLRRLIKSYIIMPILCHAPKVWRKYRFKACCFHAFDWCEISNETLSKNASLHGIQMEHFYFSFKHLLIQTYPHKIFVVSRWYRNDWEKVIAYNGLRIIISQSIVFRWFIRILNDLKTFRI